MESKQCKGCNKLMKFEDYKLYKRFSEHFFNIRVWCSEKCRLRNCSQKQYERKKWNMLLEHNQKIVKVNEIIKGEIIGINGGNKINPDIIKNNKIYEVEILGNQAFRKFKNKYGEKNKITCAIFSIRDGLINLFDEAYLMNREGKLINISNHI